MAVKNLFAVISFDDGFAEEGITDLIIEDTFENIEEARQWKVDAKLKEEIRNEKLSSYRNRIHLWNIDYENARIAAEISAESSEFISKRNEEYKAVCYSLIDELGLDKSQAREVNFFGEIGLTIYFESLGRQFGIHKIGQGLVE